MPNGYTAPPFRDEYRPSEARILARSDRADSAIRPLKFTRNYTDGPAGSVLVEAGRTMILCTVTVTDQVPHWLNGQGQAWLTAEYAMLPGSTKSRKPRDGRTHRVDGRSLEIQRLIGRSLRSVLDLKAMPEVTLWVDCDVLQADGGTRTTAINGACLAVCDALTKLQERGRLKTWPVRSLVQAISVGVVQGKVLCDLDYREDSKADVDMNVVCTQSGELVEVQASAERSTFTPEQFQAMLEMSRASCTEIGDLQSQILGNS